jgi:thioredoxin 1
MATKNITETEFMPLIESDGVVLVDFWAQWCGPCKSFAPIYEQVSENHPDAVFAKVDTEAEQALSGGLGIRSIPTLMIFRDGIQVFSQPGAIPAAALEDLVGQVKALDMDQVRTSIEEAKVDDQD